MLAHFHRIIPLNLRDEQKEQAERSTGNEIATPKPMGSLQAGTDGRIGELLPHKLLLSAVWITLCSSTNRGARSTMQYPQIRRESLKYVRILYTGLSLLHTKSGLYPTLCAIS